MNRIPLWPFAVLLFLIAVAVTLHAEGPDLKRRQEIACEAELCDCECASACEQSRLSREVTSSETAMEEFLDDTDRTHVVQDRPETSSSIFDNTCAREFTGESRHLRCEAVGAAGVCSVSHLSPIFEPFPSTAPERARDRGGPA